MNDSAIEVSFTENVGKLFAIHRDRFRTSAALSAVANDSFADPVCQFIVRAIRETVSSNGPAGIPEFVGVMRRMASEEGFSKLHEHPAWPAFGDMMMVHCRDAETELIHARCAARGVRADAAARLVAKLSSEVSTASNAGEVMSLAARVADAIDTSDSDKSTLLLDVAAEMADGAEESKPVPTGFGWWDGPAGGLWPGLSVFAGRPGTGKSALALQLVAGALRRDQSQRAIWGLGEMTKRQIAERLGACFSPIEDQCSMAEIRKWQDSGKRAVARIAGDIGERLAIVEDVSIASLSAAVTNHDATLLVLDYLQLIPGDSGESQYERLEAAAGDLLRMCRARNVCVVAISSISKSAGPDASIGSLSKGSGSFDYAAGAFYLCEVPPDADRSTGEYPVRLRCMKNRHGGLHDIETEFDGNHQRFGTPTHDAFNEWSGVA